MDVAHEKQKQLKRSLGDTFPEVLSEGTIDFEQLKRVLGQWVDPGKERFGLNWPGKADCMKIIQQPSVATLKPIREDSVNFDETENLFIEGDNLEVLKLLQKSYFGKIKMIYIDPPYNTGNDFIYPDKYSETLQTYLAYTGQIDAAGKKFSTNTDTAGRYHSRWLTMMYPRLYLGRNLLRDDGVIFISNDDHENSNLKSLCDEVFGEENFFAQVIIRSNSRGQTYKQIAKTHEYLLVYTKNPETELFELEKEGDRDDLDMLDEVGPFNLRELRNRNPKFGKHNRPNLFYPIYVDPNSTDSDSLCPISLKANDQYSIKVEPFNSLGIESCWRWGTKRTLNNISDNTKQSNLVGRKKQNGDYGVYEKYRKSTYKPKSIWDDNTFLNETGTIDLKNIGMAGLFDFPKPVGLIKQCAKMSLGPDDIVLDFFAGSATTAQAVFELNANDGGQRRFILVQLPEPVAQDTPAGKAGFRTLTDIAKERVRKSAQAINAKAQEDDTSPSNGDLDLGFRSFALDQSNFKIWDGDVEIVADLAEQLSLHVHHIAESSSREDILYELLLKAGFPLTTKVEKRKMAGAEVFSIEDGSLLICLDKEITSELVDALAEAGPLQVICLDESFKGNDQLKANAVQTFKARAVAEESEIVFKTV